MLTIGIVTAAVLVVTALAVFVPAVFGARRIAKLGPWRLLLIAVAGVAGGLLVPLPERSACAVFQQPSPPDRGCCHTNQGDVQGVTQFYCETILGGIWEYGECGTGAPLGCCLTKEGLWHWVSEKECYGPLEGTFWAKGPCPE